ncbi:hypothetical protein RI065_02460 [Mycoplasmatota bacterium zrk1]
MKKILLLISMFLLTACDKTTETNFNKDCNEDVCAFAEFNRYEQGTMVVDVKWINNNEYRVGPGDAYTLQKKVNLNWKTITKDPLRVNDGVRGFMDPNSTEVHKYSLYKFTDGLTKGKYRIVTDFLTLEDNGTIKRDMEIYFESTSEGIVDPSLENQEKYWEEAEQKYDELTGISMDMEKDIYEQGVMEVKAIITNEIDDEFTYGESFSIEKKIDGAWKKVIKDLKDEGVFHDKGYNLDKNTNVEYMYNLSPYTCGLNAGEYRIKTHVIRDTVDGKENKVDIHDRLFQVYGYFEVR